MALPAPALPALAAASPLNPVEALLNGFNTNPYFIGLMMLVMNLGGRHLATGLTPDQDRVFQHPWVRRSLLFVVIFVATRNIFTAFWLGLGIILVIGYLTNETSALYLFGKPRPPAPQPPQLPQSLTPEEQEIYRRLHDKVNRHKEASGPAPVGESEEEDASPLLQVYRSTMQQIQTMMNL